MLRSISKTFMVISVFFAVIEAQLSYGSTSWVSSVSAKSSPAHRDAGKERVFQTADLRHQCRAGNDSRVECEIDIAGRYVCDDCYHDVMVIVPAFVKASGVSGIREQFVAALQNVISADPLWLIPTTQDESLACFEHGHAQSSVLGPPYFEDASICVSVLNTAEPVSGIGFRMLMSLSVSKNPNSPYRQPEVGERSKYVLALNQAYRKAIGLACLRLQGRMLGMICELSL